MPPRWAEFHTDLAIKPCFITSHHRHLKQIFDICWKKLFDFRWAKVCSVSHWYFFHISKKNWNWKLIRNTKNRSLIWISMSLIDVFITYYVINYINKYITYYGKRVGIRNRSCWEIVLSLWGFNSLSLNRRTSFKIYNLLSE